MFVGAQDANATGILQQSSLKGGIDSYKIGFNPALQWPR
jgi:hypothetical protein|tara:strand:+ start:1273 stop:1389 length:117 start_codon:yes stop_codon:yes gene_type:complete